jgi:hypothetical protein
MLSRKHHYIPIFYLKQWCGEDKKLCEYSKPYDKVKPLRKYPSETAFETDLNTMTALAPTVQDIVERRLMSGVDNNAARALQLLLDQRINDLDAAQRTAWAVFVISLTRRTPESMQRLRERLRIDMEAHGVYSDLEGMYENNEASRQTIFQVQYAMLFQSVVTSRRIGTHLINMRWSVARFANTKHTLLTSDRPFVMTNGIGHPKSHIAVPISPVHCFIAAATPEEERTLHTIDAENFMFQINNRMALQARKFVYGADDGQLRFVANRFGKREPSMPGENEDN